MGAFGPGSEAALIGVHPSLVAVCRRARVAMDFRVLEGVRTAEQAAINLARGVSRTTHSKHLVQPDGYAHAVDLVPEPVNWNDHEIFCVLAGVMRVCAIQEGIRLRWGGDWNSDNSTTDERFRDYGHFELLEG